ncbi:hypothetical protein WIS52_12730 [Pseudonocardia nematodicida]|uniref:Uncharacterized protein n=1 Tax=Pseudonocardia nematodicida TaxID=1206997 RepID=A0ABV1KA31_9PSEU
MGKKKDKRDKKNRNDSGRAVTATTSAGSPDEQPAVPPGEDRRSVLERRRDELQTRSHAVEDAERDLQRAQEDLHNNAIASRQQEQALDAALERVAGVEKALKTSSKQHKQLRSAQTQARTALDDARRAAAVAEAKYEKAVLKEIVRREKVVDLTVHSH